jgi:CheY-like chemotaxis protein
MLHVEDDEHLAQIVCGVFRSLGFRGEILWAAGVGDALRLLSRRERTGAGLNLILVDLHLPDGNGLDVLRAVKTNPEWSFIPVVVLSGTREQAVVAEAYALGANAFLSKSPRRMSLFDALRSLHEFWFAASEPSPPLRRDQIRAQIARAAGLRARTGQVYESLARAFESDLDLAGFWFDRAMNESNLANLLLFVLKEFPPNAPVASSPKVAAMQDCVEHALHLVEERMRTSPPPSRDQAFAWGLDLVEANDEEALADGMAMLLPVAPVAARALKARAIVQLTHLVSELRASTCDSRLHQRAERVQRLADGLNARGDG